MVDDEKMERLNISKLDTNTGDIERSVNYGMGYTIVWEPKPFDVGYNKESRYGAYLEDVICACIDRLTTLQVSKYKADEYAKITQKLYECLAILKNKAGA